MSGKRQPIELLLIKGKKHLTRAEVAERKSKEIRAPADKIRPPKYLPKELKSEFNKIAKELVKIEIMSNLDVDALARFIYARHLYLKLTHAMYDMKASELAYTDMLQAQDKLFKQCRQSASDLGLTISSRCRLVMPKKEVHKEPTKEEKLFGEHL